MKRPEIVAKIQQAITGIKGMQVWLYGSEAREEARPDSDIDLLVLLQKSRVTLTDRMHVAGLFNTIELDTGVLINTFIQTEQQWNDSNSAFHQSVTRERIAL
ncbi:MAG: nucleotidyltransferase domain-containing protein [Bacteroidales bacterium]|nr:nucleotidyltransferase domain-containing protein [Bacteroidales bacterium]